MLNKHRILWAVRCWTNPRVCKRSRRQEERINTSQGWIWIQPYMIGQRCVINVTEETSCERIGDCICWCHLVSVYIFPINCPCRKLVCNGNQGLYVLMIFGLRFTYLLLINCYSWKLVCDAFSSAGPWLYRFVNYTLCGKWRWSTARLERHYLRMLTPFKCCRGEWGKNKQNSSLFTSVGEQTNEIQRFDHIAASTVKCI